MKEQIRSLLKQATLVLKDKQIIPQEVEPKIFIDKTKNKLHGDFASNLAMILAKAVELPPRILAQEIVQALPTSDIVNNVEIAGPGFINFFITTTWLSEKVKAIAHSARADIDLAEKPEQVVVDYSSPNVAKEMHVGHLRSTCIGDAVVHTLEFLGHKVIRANHIGDWGTQFGMLIAHLEEILKNDDHQLPHQVSDLEDFYRQAKHRYDQDEQFAALARLRVVQLQQGDAESLEKWRTLVQLTMEKNQHIYDRLHISLSMKDIMGESMYNDMLPELVNDLLVRGIATIDQGAVVVYSDAVKTKDGKPMGIILRKKDGGYLYATTDLACAKYRAEHLGASRILVFTDSRQIQHFQLVWSIARLAGYVPEKVHMEHYPFGMILGRDGKPFKTRSGDTIKLSDLMDEAEARALTLLESRNTPGDINSKKTLAKAIGISAIKYADLSRHRISDYIFDWDTILNFDGNTSLYLQYAYARINSIFRKMDSPLHEDMPVLLKEDAEIALASCMTQFEDALKHVAEKGYPHLLCNYLYELVSHFMHFYEACPIFKEQINQNTQVSRLILCHATANILKCGFNILGIDIIEKI